MELNNLIRDQLLRIADDLDSHESEVNSDQVDDLFMLLANQSDRNLKMSKYQACKYVDLSRANFDIKVSEGKIPKGLKQAGFKELFWRKKDLDYYNKKYKKDKK